MKHTILLAGLLLSGAARAADAPLNLEQAIAMALVNHGDVAVARQQASGAAERVVSVKSAKAPQFGIEAGYGVSNRDGVAGGSLSSHSTGASLVLRQNFFDSGLTKAQTRQAMANARGAEFGIGQARSGTAFAVANAFFDQLATTRLLELAREQVKLAEANLALVKAQAAAGAAALVDQKPVEVELRQRQFNLALTENNARTAQVNFRNALGLPRGAVVAIQDIGAEIPAIGAVDEFFAQAQKLNPDLKISRASLDAAQAGLDVAKLRAGAIFSVDANAAAGVLDSPRTSSGLTAAVTLPLFDGGARKAERNAAKDSVEAARLRDVQLAKDITAGIDSAWASAASARDRIAAARALEESATVNLQAAQEKYKQGLGIALEVTTAQLQLFNAQISSIGALYDYHQARAALDRATGRWSGLK